MRCGLLFWAVVCTSHGLWGAEKAAVQQPNIVILLADDLGYGELGCQGNTQILTPHIDSIAEQGVRFTQGYVTGPNCSPSRAGLLTGKIPTRFGYEFNPIGPRNEDPQIGLPASEVTLAEVLHARGYTTGMVGKWHLGGTAAYHPLRHGFDEFFGFTHEGHYFVPPPYTGVTTMLRRKTLPGGGQGRWAGSNLIYSTHMGHDEPAYDANNPLLRQSQPIDERSYLTDAFTREAVNFIDRHHDKPFFLYVAYNAVHSPLQGKQELMDRLGDIDDIQRRIFAAMLVALDDSVGKILSQIDDSQIERQTWVIFLSDNGGPTRELTSSNLPLRGEKGSMYEGGLRVPFMMKWPGTLPEGSLYQHPVSSTDLMATAAALTGAAVEHAIDGRDLFPYLTGAQEGAPHDEFYWRQGGRSALRSDDWKLVRLQSGKSQVTWELYDLARDISEGHNLAEDYPQHLLRLQQRWKEVDAEMEPAMF